MVEGCSPITKSPIGKRDLVCKDQYADFQLYMHMRQKFLENEGKPSNSRISKEPPRALSLASEALAQNEVENTPLLVSIRSCCTFLSALEFW